jgi:hypothetical protein
MANFLYKVKIHETLPAISNYVGKEMSKYVLCNVQVRLGNVLTHKANILGE